MRGSLFTGGSSDNWDREEYDYYATPTKTTLALLEKVELKGSILEPSCGEGHISKVLHEIYPAQEIISYDLIDRGYGDGQVDFLTHDFGRKFDNIITNPPFKFAKEFVENSPLKYVYCFSERQATMRNGWELNPKTGKPWSTAMFLAWFVWEKGYDGEPIIRWI